MYNHKICRLFIYVSNESSPCLNETVILYFRKPIRFLYFAISFSTALKSDIRHCQFGLPAFPGVFIFQYIHPGRKFSSLFPVHFSFSPGIPASKRIAIMDINFRNCSVPSQWLLNSCFTIFLPDAPLPDHIQQQQMHRIECIAEISEPSFVISLFSIIEPYGNKSQ